MHFRDIVIISIASFGLAGCYLDPYQDPGQWSLTSAPSENLAVQTANPADLISGQSVPNSNGVAASAAIDKALGGPAGTAAGLQTVPTALTQNTGG